MSARGNVPRLAWARSGPRTRRALRDLDSRGFRFELGGTGHVQVRTPAGDLIATLACTPSDYRADANTASVIRRALRTLEADDFSR